MCTMVQFQNPYLSNKSKGMITSWTMVGSTLRKLDSFQRLIYIRGVTFFLPRAQPRMIIYSRDFNQDKNQI